jgi:hypothetical protein
MAKGAALEGPGGRNAVEVPEGAEVPSDGDQEKEQLTGLPLFGDKGETLR